MWKPLERLMGLVRGEKSAPVSVPRSYESSFRVMDIAEVAERSRQDAIFDRPPTVALVEWEVEKIRSDYFDDMAEPMKDYWPEIPEGEKLAAIEKGTRFQELEADDQTTILTRHVGRYRPEASQEFQFYQAKDHLAASSAGRILGMPEPKFPADYQHAAIVRARDLDHAFELTNIGPDVDTPWDENAEVKLIANAPRSGSIGDVFVDEAGKAHRIEMEGFQEIRREPNMLEEWRGKLDPLPEKQGRTKEIER